VSETKYIELPGEIVLRQPIALTGATMYCWLLDADPAKLRTLCDQVFNGLPSGWEYRPLLPAVALICADMGRGQSMDPVDHEKGGMPEKDLGFWVPLVRGKTKDGVFFMDAIVWYHPYLFIDNEAAFVVGRETYGFRKYSAECTMPGGDDDASTFAVKTLYIEKFAATSTGEVGTLWTLTADGKRGPLGAELSSFEHLIEEAVKGVRERFGRTSDGSGFPVPTWQLIETLMRDLLKGEVPMVFLRQIRDVSKCDCAAYQAIIEAPCKMTKWRGAGLVRPHTLTIKTVDSHPIVSQLGLRAPSFETGIGWWIGLDFIMGNGTTIWEAG
jgi:hypothetical protein